MRRHEGHRFVLFLLATLALAGWWSRSLEARPAPLLLQEAPEGERHVFLGVPVLVDATLLTATQEAGEGFVTELQLLAVQRGAARRPGRDRVRLYSPSPLPGLPGDRLRAWITLRLPTEFCNGAPRAPARSRPLTGRLKSSRLVVQAQRSHPPAPAAFWARLRRELEQRLDTGLIRGGADPRARALAAALVLGQRERLADDDQQRLRQAGAAHLLAISGLHVTVLVGLFAGSLRWLGGSRAVVLATTIVALLFYVTLLPARVSIVRAALMGMLIPMGGLLGRRTDGLNILGGVALVCLAAAPSLRGDPGFCLSFAVTAALVRLGSATAPRPAPGAGALRLLGASLVATAAGLPLTCYFFGEAAPAGVLVNLLAVPAAALLVLLATAGTFAAVVHPVLAAVVAPPLSLTCRLLYATADLAALLPGGHLIVSSGRGFLAVAMLVFLYGCGASRGSTRQACRVLALVTAGALVAGVAPANPLPPGALSLRALDVGQGDALLVGLPDGEALLVDGGGIRGGKLDVGRRLVVPALARAGIHRLQAIALTHPHFDHGDGLRRVLEELDVGELWLPQLRGHQLLEQLTDMAVSRGVAVRVLHQGERLFRAGAVIHCLNPGRGWSGTGNDRSLVLRVQSAGGSLMLTGDIEAQGEAALVAGGWISPTTVLKVAHHGSGTSTSDAFLRASLPQVAIISVGRSNPWAHPDDMVLERLSLAAIPAYRTDEMGAVTVEVTDFGARIVPGCTP